MVYSNGVKTATWKTAWWRCHRERRNGEDSMAFAWGWWRPSTQVQAQTKEGVLGGERSLQCSCGENSCVDTLWSSADLKGAGLTKGTYSVPADIVGCSEPLSNAWYTGAERIGWFGEHFWVAWGKPSTPSQGVPQRHRWKSPLSFLRAVKLQNHGGFLTCKAQDAAWHPASWVRKAPTQAPLVPLHYWK